jgi:hypothetical protein
MALERTYSEVLNLRIDAPLASEIKRIAAQRGSSESDTARLLLTWGVEAHRAMEAKQLLRRYDAAPINEPVRMVIDVRWEQYDEWDEQDEREALPGR